jgi:hypothetical protein
VVSALGSQPLALALIVCNFALLIFVYYALTGAAASRELIIKQVLANSENIHKMVQQRSVACPDPAPPTP